MVLELVRELARLKDRRIPHNPLESTDLWVPEDVAHIVCRKRG